MGLVKVALIAVVVFMVWYLMTRTSPNSPPGNSREGYGGRQKECEELCFSSQYYDACMNVCLEGSSAGWTGRADEYSLPAVEAPMPLDEDMGQEYVSTFAGPYRYDYPGH